MFRQRLEPRPNWQKRLEDAGCYFHTIDGKPYWNETAAYCFQSWQIDQIEDATDQLHRMALTVAGRVVESGDYHAYGFPDAVKALVEESWKRGDPSLFGRFDLAYNPDLANPIKLLEYNADTPTALPEASVWQWHALTDCSWADQFNSIHEALAAQWDKLRRDYSLGRVHFAAMAMKEGSQREDWGNLHYMQEVAAEVGIPTTSIDLESIGWSEESKCFADEVARPITALFKLYPWEWMMRDEYGWKVRESSALFLEPAWKMLLSSKALLVRMWEAYPDHPLLLPAMIDEGVRRDRGGGYWVRKPLLGREGANVSISKDGSAGASIRPEYDDRGYVLQEYCPIKSYDGKTPVLGVWVVGDKACGMGIREDDGPITTNASQFVPHYFVE